MLYSFQKKAVEEAVNCLRENRGYLLNEEMGLGKTYQAVEIARRLKKKVLVICPKYAIEKWASLLEGMDVVGIVNYALFREGKKRIYIPSKYDERRVKEWKRIYGCGTVKGTTNIRKKMYEDGYLDRIREGRGYVYRVKEKYMVKKWLEETREMDYDIEDSLIVIDECHRLKNYSSKNAKSVRNLWKNRTTKFLLLTATLGTLPTELGMVALLLGKLNGSYYSFLRRWKVEWCKYPSFSRYEYLGSDRELRELGKELMENGYRLTYKDIEDPPEYRREAVVLVGTWRKEMEKERRRIEKRIALLRRLWEMYIGKRGYGIKDMKEVVEGSDVDTLISNFLVYATSLKPQLRQKRMELGEIEKLGKLWDMVEGDMEAGISSIILLRFNASLNVFEKIVENEGWECVRVDGSTKKGKRIENMALFQKNEVYIFIGNLEACKEAIDLHDLHGRQRHLYITPTDSAFSLVQALGRNRRLNQKSVALQTILFSEKEEEGYVNVKKKIENLNSIQDSDLRSFRI